MIRARVGMLVLAGALLAPGLAHAQDHRPSSSERETARGLMDQGVAQRGRGDLEAALKSFQAADAIMGVPTTGLEVARTQALLGKLVEARDTAQRVARTKPTAGEPPQFTDARTKANAMVGELEERIPSVQVTLHGFGGGAKVVVDGATVPLASIATPLRLNPGGHVVVVRDEGKDAQAEVTLAERDRKKVALEPRGAVAAAPASATPVTTPASSSSPSTSPSRGGVSPLAIGGFAIGAAGIALGGVTGVLALGKKKKLAGECDHDACPRAVYESPAFQDDLSSGRTLARLSTISFVVGAVGVSAGVLGLVLRRGGEPTTGHTTIRLAVSPSSAAVYGQF